MKIKIGIFVFIMLAAVSLRAFEIDNNELKYMDALNKSQKVIDENKNMLKEISQKNFDVEQAQYLKIIAEENENKKIYYDFMNYRYDKINKYITALTESLGLTNQKIGENKKDITKINQLIVGIEEKIGLINENILRLDSRISDNLAKIKNNAIDIETLNKLKVLRDLVSELSKKIDYLEVKSNKLEKQNEAGEITAKRLETELSSLTGSTKVLQHKLENYVVEKNSDIAAAEGKTVSDKIEFTEKKKENLVDITLINLLMDKAKKSFDIKDYEKAVYSYNQVIEYDPMNIQAYYNSAICHYLMKNDAQALDYFLKVIQLNPNEKDAYVYSGILYYKMNELEKASLIWRKLLQIDPDNEIAQKNLRKIQLSR